jgi:hypothetical protein
VSYVEQKGLGESTVAVRESVTGAGTAVSGCEEGGRGSFIDPH